MMQMMACNGVDCMIMVLIDSVDPEFAPSTGTRVRGGLSYREAYFIAESLAETGIFLSAGHIHLSSIFPSSLPFLSIPHLSMNE
jgi:hypothetical protein